MHKDEMWQVFRPNGEAMAGVGREAARGNPEEGEAEIVGVTVVILYRMGEQGVELLWQRRSAQVDKHPGEWDYSAGGHINLGESLVEGALREAREEIGVEIHADELQLMEMVGYTANRFGWVYMVDWTGREEAFCFDDHEVSEVRWVPWAETHEFVKRYAKKPIKKDKVTFKMLEKWLEERGLISGDI